MNTIYKRHCVLEQCLMYSNLYRDLYTHIYTHTHTKAFYMFVSVLERTRMYFIEPCEMELKSNNESTIHTPGSPGETQEGKGEAWSVPEPHTYIILHVFTMHTHSNSYSQTPFGKNTNSLEEWRIEQYKHLVTFVTFKGISYMIEIKYFEHVVW